MDREEALKLLRGGPDGVREWNRARADNTHPPSLRGAILVHAKMRSADLKGMDLGTADLRGADLSHADLSRSNLNRADASGANLEFSDLTSASLYRADLHGARLNHVSLSGANLDRADLGRAELLGARLNSASLRSTNLNSAQLAGAMLGGTAMGASLAKARDLELVIHHAPSMIDMDCLRSVRDEHRKPLLRGIGLDDQTIEFFTAHLGTAVSYYSAFISYSTKDKEFARMLHDALQGRGVRCWLDEHEILPGDDLHDKINEGIRLYDKVLLCASESSLTSWWVDREIARATKKEERLWKERGERVLSLIPLNLDGHLLAKAEDGADVWTAGFADDLRGRKAADFTGWATDVAKFNEQLERVVKALREDRGQVMPPPEPKL